MNTSPISPDDPRLTTYALGEMEESEQAAFEELLRDDHAAQAAVEAIRATANDLESALTLEPLPEVESADDPYRKPPAQIFSFPRFYFVAGTLAAACFAFMVALHEPEQREIAEQKQYTEISLLELPTIEAPVLDGQMAASKLAVPAVHEESSEMFADALKKEISRRQAEQMAARASTASLYGGLSKKNVGQVMLSARGAAAVAEPKFNTENYAHQQENGFRQVSDHPLSTFSVDVDTASYANVRRFLQMGNLPPVDAVRIEELINYFPYDYAPPSDGSPFAASMEVAAAPWAPEHRLVRVGLKGREVTVESRPAANLVFLLDVSGSMNSAKKLPLVKQAMRLLVERLRDDDRVAIVTYAGASGLALASTPARRSAEILKAMDALSPEGSTNGAMGIQLAYDIAKANYVPDGLNRVILCTDGDFNVGVSDEGGLTRLIEEKAKTGVFLSVLGFGMGNYQDSTLEKLADKGNGNYGYIDSRREAEKLLVEQINGTLVTIAKDVKLQVEFNRTQVASYRLIGYENRMLQKEDFNNDKVDAGEIGAGHTVTALYEIVPVGVAAVSTGTVDELKYQAPELTHPKVQFDHYDPKMSELLTLKVRFKAPDGDTSDLLEFPLVDAGATFAMASDDFKFATAVAGYGMLLRDSELKGTTQWGAVIDWARAGVSNDAGGYRSEFIDLVQKAEKLTSRQ